jgi:hypothetical protein
MIDCQCPLPTALATSPTDPCKSVIGKIAKMFFQRLDDANNSFVEGTNGIALQTSWSALPAAADDTKIVITPELEDVIFAEPDILEDSENFDGAPIAIASGAQLVTAMFRNPTKEQLAALRALKCEPNLTVYFVDNNGKFLSREITDTPNITVAGVKISKGTFIMRDPAKAGTKADQFKAMIQFYLPEGWFDSANVTPSEDTFDPLTDLSA